MESTRRGCFKRFPFQGAVKFIAIHSKTKADAASILQDAKRREGFEEHFKEHERNKAESLQDSEA
jgi:hypothetical protein